MPYKLIFDVKTVRVEPVTLLEGKAQGELEGFGLWALKSKDQATIVRYDWQVSTSKRWMNFMAPLMRPIFKWNHNVVMSWGASGLSKRLGVCVIED